MPASAIGHLHLLAHCLEYFPQVIYLGSLPLVRSWLKIILSENLYMVILLKQFSARTHTVLTILTLYLLWADCLSPLTFI